jgi:hypothetical protein
MMDQNIEDVTKDMDDEPDSTSDDFNVLDLENSSDGSESNVSHCLL